MGIFADEAYGHEEEIRKHYRNAAANGFKQALHHFEKLYTLRASADSSTSSKGDVPIISEIIRSLHGIMAEMEVREAD